VQNWPFDEHPHILGEWFEALDEEKTLFWAYPFVIPNFVTEGKTSTSDGKRF